MNNSQAVYELQRTHDAIDKITHVLLGYKKELEDDTSVRMAEITLRANRGNLLKNEQDQKKLDAEFSALSTKIREDETRLYNGKVKSPKEMIELQHEIEHQKIRLLEIEERSFACLSQNEALTSKALEAESALQGIINSRSDQLISVKLLADQATAELSSLQNKYTEQRRLLSADLLANFDRLLLSKNNRAVALIIEDSCDVCGTLLSKQVILSSRSAASPNVCPTCNRMLYHEH